MVARSRHQPLFVPLSGLRKAMVIPAKGDLYITVIPAKAGIQRGYGLGLLVPVLSPLLVRNPELDVVHDDGNADARVAPYEERS